MNRQFSSNNSISLIQWDECVDDNKRIARCNSLVEMFDPIFDKTSQDSKDNNLFLSSTSSDDIFAPVSNKTNTSKIGWIFDDNVVDDIFVDTCIETQMEPAKESIYPSLKSFKNSYSIERYSVFTSLDETPSQQEVNYPNLRPSIFKEITIDPNDKSVLYDTHACKDMERMMKTLTELYMQSLNLRTDERSHLVFDQVFRAEFDSDKCYQTSHVIVQISESQISTTGSPFSAEINPYVVSERSLVSMIMAKHYVGERCLDLSKFFLRIHSRSEYLRQGDFPLVLNQTFFQNYRTENDIKLILEYIDFTDDKYRMMDDWYSDTSCAIYQILERDFYCIPRQSLEEIFSNLTNYRNSVVSQLKEYRSAYLDLSCIDASIRVFTDQCRAMCLISYDLYTASVNQKIQEINTLTKTLISAYETHEDWAITKSVENLIECLDHALKLITQFVHELTVFCNCNYAVRPEKLNKAGMMSSQSGGQPITKFRSNFYVKLGSICGLSNTGHYTSYFIKITIKVGRQRLAEYHRPRTIPFCDTKQSSAAYSTKPLQEFPAYIPFNETIVFENMSMHCMPSEACMVISVFGRRVSTSVDSQAVQEEEIAWTEVPLFDAGGVLNQGGMLIGLWTEGKKLKWSMGMNRAKNAPVLQIELPVFHVPVKYSRESSNITMDISDRELSGTDRKAIDDAVECIWMRNHSASKATCGDLLWKNRAHLTNTPRQYIALCIAVATTWPDNIEADNKDFLVDYLELCKRDLHPIAATELLYLIGPNMPVLRVRRWAIECLRDIGSDGCMSIIPALVEALKYDSGFNSSGLEEMLFHFSISNVNFSTSLFWQFSSVGREDYHGYRSIMLLGMLRAIVGNIIAEMWNNQLTVVDHFQVAANAVKSAKGGQSTRKNIMHTKLEELYDLFTRRDALTPGMGAQHPLCGYRVPYQPGIQLLKLEMKDCSYFNSFTMPLRIVFKGLDNSIVEVMFKSGDDLRQDILILQLFRLMDDLWISEGLDLRMIHYKVMSTGHRCGLVELVGDCTTLRKIQEIRGGIAAPLTNASVITEWLKSQNNTKAAYVQSVRNFLLTCVACCVSTYLLGIGDRHNDNIMIQTNGRMFHIDFAKILGDAQTIAGIKRDRVPFVLTQDMVFVLEDYVAQDSDRRTGMQLLIDKSCEAFNIIRKHWCSLVSVLTMAADANIPGVNSTTILYVIKMLRLKDSDIQASEHFTDLIKKCVSSISTPFNFVLHNLAQMKYSSNNEGSLFTFTPKIHSNGPKILEIGVLRVEKLRSPNKQYIYHLRVVTEGQKVNTVFRRFEHFVELAQQLASMFPLSIIPKLAQPILNSGPPTSIVSAEGRRMMLQQFVSGVLAQGDEIRQCDHMQTFFHSTLFDENTNEEQTKELHILTKTESLGSMKLPEIQVQFNLAKDCRKLEVFVKHARNLLSTRSNEPPNAYVKTYILPNYNNSSKRKTSIVMRDYSPSFNDIITYQDLVLKPDTRLEISVWHHETLGENFCLGKVVVPIKKSMSGEDRWLRLQADGLGQTFAANRTPLRASERHSSAPRKSAPADWKDLLNYDSSRYV